MKLSSHKKEKNIEAELQEVAVSLLIIHLRYGFNVAIKGFLKPVNHFFALVKASNHREHYHKCKFQSVRMACM